MPALSPDQPFIHPDCQIMESTFGAYVEIGTGSRIGRSHIGDYSYCDRFGDIANSTVGKFANIASFVRLGPTDHPMHLASLHHFHYRSSYYWPEEADDPAFFARRNARNTVIGHDTWIGHGAIVRPDVTIGHGAVVAAGAVVTKDVAPYVIVAGVPAVQIKRRYDEPLADRMMALAWWDWDHAAIRRALPDFRTLPAEAFVEKYA